jgi:hypothetical protein
MGHPMLPLAPGVHGVTRDDPDGSLVIVMVAAENPGCGDGGRYLDGLPKDRRIVVEACISMRLAKMLERRGFNYILRACVDPDMGEWSDGYVRGSI